MSRPTTPVRSPKVFNLVLFAGLLVQSLPGFAAGTAASITQRNDASIPRSMMLRIVRAEDERRWDADVSGLLMDSSAALRKRAALAAGRIGDERAVPVLISLLKDDPDDGVRAMAAFALGETESAAAGDALITQLSTTEPSEVRARVVEALGKTTAALPRTEETRLRASRSAVLSVLESEARRPPPQDTLVILMGLTAALRARPENVGKVVAEFLTHSDSRVRADAANTLGRLRAKEGNELLRKLLATDPDAVVRANAARVLGATEDKNAFEGLVELSTKDGDSRVRVSAIRALAELKDQEPRVGDALASIGCQRYLRKSGDLLYHERDAVCLELIAALGRVFQGSDNKEVLGQIDHWQWDLHGFPPEVKIAEVRISPHTFLLKLGEQDKAKQRVRGMMYSDWREASSMAQALGEIAALPESTKDKTQLDAQAESLLRAMLDFRKSGQKQSKKDALESQYAIPDVLRALAAFKPPDLNLILRDHLKEPDVVVRGTAADLLGEQRPDEANTRALASALPIALTDKESNDGVLSILAALGNQKSQAANDAIKSALDSQDHLVRRRAVALLKSNGAASDYLSRIGTVATKYTESDYKRAISRFGKTVLATVHTDKGSFSIELLPEEAPLNVDNFVQLAKRGYFRGITFHRVVPNFVIQVGDPRGDGNGGPGYQVRCEINDVPYERGAVGMALSGKDTGGSQWFVTHSPQPHLDGGYTVFGRVVKGMEVVDAIVRGNLIRSIVVVERPARTRE